MSDLIITSQSDFLAFIHDQAMLNGNLSIRGTARCCGVPVQTLQDAYLSVSGKLSKILSGNGFDSSGFSEEGFPPQAVWLCIEYYAFESRAKAQMAKQLARTFGAVGIMTTLKELSKPVQSERQLPPARDIIDYVQAKSFIDNCSDPLFRSVANQRLLEEMGAGKLLPVEGQPTQVLVAVRAKQLGYTEKEIGTGARLGSFVKKVLKPNGKTQHGRYAVNVFDLTPELDETIHAFFR